MNGQILKVLAAAVVGDAIRTGQLGKEISKYREGEDQYSIMLRFEENQRKDIEQLLNLTITYRDMNSGLLRQIPLSVVAHVDYVNSYGQINRLNLKRVITISSNVLDGYNANLINAQLRKVIPEFTKSSDIDIRITGEQEDQAESMAFPFKSNDSLFVPYYVYTDYPVQLNVEGTDNCIRSCIQSYRCSAGIYDLRYDNLNYYDRYGYCGTCRYRGQERNIACGIYRCTEREGCENPEGYYSGRNDHVSLL